MQKQILINRTKLFINLKLSLVLSPSTFLCIIPLHFSLSLSLSLSLFPSLSLSLSLSHAHTHYGCIKKCKTRTEQVKLELSKTQRWSMPFHNQFIFKNKISFFEFEQNCFFFAFCVFFKPHVLKFALFFQFFAIGAKTWEMVGLSFDQTLINEPTLIPIRPRTIKNWCQSQTYPPFTLVG